MKELEYSESFLMMKFREFYTEVIAIKRQVTSKSWSATGEGGDFQQNMGKAVQNTSQHLIRLLEHQAMEAEISGGHFASLFREVQYIMAVLADEIFLYLDWDGRQAWRNHLLEARIFRTSIAGDLFFNRLDQLLKSRDPVHLELAKVYLMALALGFKGKHRGDEGKDKLDNYRKQLFSFIFNRTPEALKDFLYENDSKRLFPQAHAYTLDHDAGRSLPNLRLWYTVLGVLVLVMFVISYGVWMHDTAEIRLIVQSILHDA